MTRTEFGYERTSCSCALCKINCSYMPGFLIPSDLERMIPEGAEPSEWAKSNLLASPGALVVKAGKRFRIHTLVPAVKEDLSCIHLTEDKRCAIHEVSPFGCAFFDCRSSARNNDYDRDERALSAHGLTVIFQEWEHYNSGGKSLYCSLWKHLNKRGYCQQPPDVLTKLIRLAVEEHVREEQQNVIRS